MRRIVFVLDALRIGGAQSHTMNLALHLLRAGNDVRVVAYTHAQVALNVAPELTERCTVLGFDRVLDRRGILALSATLRAMDMDVIVAVNQAATVLVALARFLHVRGRFISVFHTTVLMPGVWDTRRFWLYRLALIAMDRLIYVSHNQRAYWSRRWLFCRRSSTIPNGVNLERYGRSAEPWRATTRSRLGIPEDEYVIGLCAAFRPEKNHKQLVTALGALLGRGVRAKLLFVGDGTTRAETEAFVQSRRLHSHVLFVGTQADVRPYIASMDVGVLCSVAVETFSIAALEIMAMGRPMVMSNIGGASEIVRDRIDGALFSVGDTNALVNALVWLADSATRQAVGAAAREACIARHSEPAMLQRYFTIFASSRRRAGRELPRALGERS